MIIDLSMMAIDNSTLKCPDRPESMIRLDVNPRLNQIQRINARPVITTDKQSCLSLTRLKNLTGSLAFTHKSSQKICVKQEPLTT